jgi:hypothetical protein
VQHDGFRGEAEEGHTTENLRVAIIFLFSPLSTCLHSYLAASKAILLPNPSVASTTLQTFPIAASKDSAEPKI